MGEEMKRPNVSKNPERKSLGKVAKAVGKYIRTVSGLGMFYDNGARPGPGSPPKRPMEKIGPNSAKKKVKKISPNSTKKTIKKPTNKW